MVKQPSRYTQRRQQCGAPKNAGSPLACTAVWECSQHGVLDGDTVKVVRLCMQSAEELNLEWAAEARKRAGPRGRNRWFGKMPDGTILIQKP